MAEAKTGSRIFLLSSLALGVLAMVAAFVFLQNTAGKETGPTAKILIAARDLRENAVLDPDKDLAELAIPKTMTALLARALDPEFRSAYKGQRVNRALQAGQVVMKADLAAGGVMELRGDMRAMSVQVKGANGLGGLLVPGDYVRLMVTRPIPPRRATLSTQPTQPTEPVEAQAPQEFITVAIDPPFKVLAVNNQMSRSRSQVTAAEAYQSASETIANPTVTLEVTEADATSILKETGAGKFPLTLLLCPPPPQPAAGH